jgi:hypothetical protein
VPVVDAALVGYAAVATVVPLLVSTATAVLVMGDKGGPALPRDWTPLTSPRSHARGEMTPRPFDWYADFEPSGFAEWPCEVLSLLAPT